MNYLFNFLLEDAYDDRLKNYKKFESHEVISSTTPTDQLFPVAYSQPSHRNHHHHRTLRSDSLSLTFTITNRESHSTTLPQPSLPPQQQQHFASISDDDVGNSIIDSSSPSTSVFPIEASMESRSLSNSRLLEFTTTFSSIPFGSSPLDNQHIES
jgi:hypothetical protein